MASKYGDLSCGCISRRRKLCSAILLVLSQTANALPQGGQVVSGSADLVADANTLVVNQQSDRAVIDYQSFNVAQDERVQFIQPNAQSAVLNRVIGNDLSTIAGRIDANGQVFLINPNGVLFGENASVDVGSLVVTTLDIDNSDFANNRLQLNGEQGRIENHGSLQAQQGIYLVAPEVVNEGQISASEVGLISGHAVLIQPEGSEIALLVDEAQMHGTISQLGDVSAERVLLALQGQANGSAIGNDGLVRAQSLSGDGGSIQLLAGGGEIHNQGTLSADGVGVGGEVTIDAAHYSQTGEVRASGGAGDGGDIHIHTGETLVLYPDAHIDASAGSEGNGGEVIVFSEQATWLGNDATISARGGKESGDGGFVEVSGREYISVGGDVDVGADHGQGGLWYIDPTDITIRSTDIGGSFVGGNPLNWNFNSVSATSEINIISLRNALANGNVNINTASAAGSVGNITFDGTLDFNGLGLTRTLTLIADGAIIFTALGLVQDSDFSSSNDGVNFIATAQNGFMMDENSSIHSGAGKIAIVTNGGNATITGLGAFGGDADAISVTASAGRITDAGSSLWDLFVGPTGGGVVLNGRDGIDHLQGVVASVDLASANGDVAFAGNDISFTVTRAEAAGAVALASEMSLVFADSAVVNASQVDVYSGQSIALPTTGLTVNGDLYLEAPDITDNLGGRTLTLQADDVAINSPFTGGDVQLNTDLDFLSYSNNSNNTITITDVDDLTLEQIEPLTGALIINSGAASDITLSTDIDLDGMTGSLTLNASNNLLVNSSLQDTTGAVDNATNITLIAGSDVVFAADGVIHAGTGTLAVNAGGNTALGNLAGSSIDIVTGGNITDANGALANITATSATLDAGGAIASSADLLEGSVATLDVTATGGAFWQNAQALTLSNIDVGGDLTVNLVAAGDLTLTQSNPVLAGDAQFNLNSGRLVIPDAGWNTTGNLTVSAQSLVDSDATVSLTAADADLDLNGASAVLNVDFDSLIFANNSSNSFSIADSDDLSLQNISPVSGTTLISTGAGADLILATDIDLDGMTGSLTLNASNNLLVNSSLQDTTGAVDNATNITLIAGSDVVFAADGVIHAGTGTMAVNAGGNTALGNLAGASVDVVAGGNITDANGALANITATSATLDAGGAIASSADLLEGSVATLDVTATGGAFWQNAQAFTLSNIDVGGDLTVNLIAAGDFTLTQSNPVLAGDAQFNLNSGRLVIPDAGWNTTGNLTVSAQSIVDFDTTVSLTAANADLSLNSANAVLNVDFDSLIFANSSSDIISVADSDGLTLRNISSVSGTTVFSSGAGADLVLATDVDLDGMVGSLILIASNDLMINASLLDVTGAVDNASNMTLTAGSNVVFAADSAIHAGTGTLAVNAGGNITLGDLAGASVSIIAGGNITDANGVLANITAASATLDAGGAIASLADSLEGSVSNLDLTSVGGAFWNNSQALTLSNADIGGDLNIQLTAPGDLTMTQANPTIVGNVQLDLASGQWAVPDAGWTITGDLTVAAQGIVDSDNSVTLNAANADLSVGGTAAIFNVDFDSLALQILNGQAVQVVDSDELTITNISTAGDLALTTGGSGDLTITDTTPALGADLVIDVGGDLILPDAGLASAGDLTIAANNILDSDTTVVLSGANANLTLRDGAAATTVNGSFAQLSLANTGTGTVTINNDQSLQVNTLSSGGDAQFVVSGDINWVSTSPSVGGDLLLDASGDVVIPDSGLTITNGLLVSAADLLDSDHDLTLNAASADIDLSAANTDANWTTAFDALTLQRTGTSSLSIINDRSIVLSGLQAGADFSLDVNGDLTLAANPILPGNLTLIASGAMTLPSGGLSIANNLQLQADSLSDGDIDISLAADHLDVRLANQNSATQLTTSVASLSLQLAGSGALTLDNSTDVIANQLQTAADLTLRAAGDITLMEAAPALGGNLSLVTSGNGVVQIDDAGLSFGGDLTLDAAAISDSDNDVSLAAANADISLRNLIADAGFTTQLASSSWDVSGAAVSVAQTGAHSLQAVTVSHAFSFTTTGDLAIAAAQLNTTAAVSLDSGTANMVINNAGLSTQGNLSLAAAQLSDGDSGAIQLIANQLDLQVGNTVLDITGQLNQLALTAANANQIAINNSGALNVNQWSAPAADLVQLVINGDLTMPAIGLSALQRLEISASDLTDGDRQLNLATNNLVLSLAAPAGDLELQTQVQNLDASLGGPASLLVSQSGDLQILDMNADGRAIDINDGDLQVDIADGNLQIEGNIFAADLMADGIRQGVIELNVTRGSLLIAQAYNIAVQSTSVDVAQLADGFSPGVILQLREAETGTDTVVLGSAVQSTTISAVGSDILIDVQNTEQSASMDEALIIADGSSLNAYNQNTDAVTGQVLINDVVANNSSELVARAGRSISLKYSAEPIIVESESGILEELDQIEDLNIVPENGSPTASLVDIQFNKVFGQCNETDENDQQRCRVNAALKSFLSHWLVGGELPPKSDI